MNYLLVNWLDMENPAAGGAEVHIMEIFRRCVAQGDSATLVASGFPGCTSETEYEGIRVIRTGTRETYNFTAPRIIRRLSRTGNFDLVVDDINKIPLYTPLYVRQPVLAMVPHLFGSTIFREVNPLIASYVYLMEKPIRFIYRHSPFEVISESTADDLVARGISSDSIHVVHCGIDHDLYSYDATASPFEQPTILFVGRIRKYKGIDIVLKALPAIIEKVPNVRLIIVGAGDYYDQLKKNITKAKLNDYVDCTGFVTQEEKVDYLRRSHVLVNPSSKEGWGLTNIEANACGTVTVASNVDGLRDSVKDGESGILFPYGDYREMARNIIQLLTDTVYRTHMEKTALAWAARFTWDRTAEETRTLCHTIVREHESKLSL